MRLWPVHPNDPNVQWLEAIASHLTFCEALPCHLPGDAASQQRLPDLHRKLEQLAALSGGGDAFHLPCVLP
jgi:hypothetical protein